MLVQEATLKEESYQAILDFRRRVKNGELGEFINYSEEKTCQYGRPDKGIPSRPFLRSHFSYQRETERDNPNSRVLITFNDFYEEEKAKMTFITLWPPLYDEATTEVRRYAGIGPLQTESALDIITIVA